MMRTSSLTDVKDTVSDAVSSGMDYVHGLASSASAQVPEITDTVTKNVSDVGKHVSENVSKAARTARRRLGVAPPPRRPNKWALIVAIALGAIVVGWWLRGRDSSDGSVES